MPASSVSNIPNQMSISERLTRFTRDFRERRRPRSANVNVYAELLDNSYKELLEIGNAIRRQQAFNMGITLPDNISGSTENNSNHLNVIQRDGNCDEKEGDVCAICLEENNKTGRQKLDCGHGYHEECIRRWLLRKNVCPLCRATVMDVDFQ